VDISNLEFDLDGAPEFVKGKILEFQFSGKGRLGSGLYRVGIFTSWTMGKVEMFFYPIIQNGDKEFLDCVPSGENTYACSTRGRKAGNTIRMVVQDSKISLYPSDGSIAEGRVAGEFPIPTQPQTSSSQP
jgi:hypothetical protein